MSLAETYAKVRPACVGIALQLENDTGMSFISFGSGACVDSSGIIVTAKHVVTSYYRDVKGEPPSRTAPSDPDFRIIFSRMAAMRYELAYAKPLAILLNEEYDVALIKIPMPNGGWPAFELPDVWEVREGDQVATAGYPLRSWADTNAFPELFSGIVSGVHCSYDAAKKGWIPQRLVLDMSIHPGNSGGPVFDVLTGQLVAIVESQKLRRAALLEAINVMNKNARQDVPDDEAPVEVWTNISYCVPWTAIKPGIEEIKKLPATG